ncbi:hypothetical protein [Polyangium mundeleinium]|uniref:STAS/SEC14 domain-containing protein n=1 Tax=Polyangium mundeleinium TaxID=2995306 RepID=A0ABT5ERG8_9BACT|nr:hypothetical protein [Polyangium mundeleinium]MDC0744421.1 hypothetical protein [Polyangium mundeleinium]
MPPSPDESHVLTEEPDLVLFHFRGHITTRDEAQRLYDVQLRFSDGKPHIFLILDVRALDQMTAEARRVVIDGPANNRPVVPVLGCAFIGATFHFRVLGTMIFRAARLLRGANTFPVRFCDTEAEARAFIDELRRDLPRPR